MRALLNLIFSWFLDLNNEPKDTMVAVKYMGEYDYIPSIPAAVVFIVLFGILTLLHCWQMFRGRTWFFIAFIFGGICEYELNVLTCYCDLSSGCFLGLSNTRFL